MRKLTILSILLLAALPAAAQVVTTIHLDNIPSVTCDEVWQADGVDMYFTSTTIEDCDGGGSCFFGTFQGASLYPARLVADFGETYQITRIEIDVTDYCGAGCTRAFAYHQGALQVATQNTTIAAPEVLVLEMPGGAPFPADELAVSSCEGVVLGSTIRIYADTVGNENRPWTSIKGDYR